MATAIMVIYPDTAVAWNDEGYVNVSGLHLRSSPESTRDGVTHTDNVITTLAHGDSVVILANVNGWLRVQSRGREGYVWNTFITISSAPTLAPVVTPAPQPIPTPIPQVAPTPDPTPAPQSPIIHPVPTPAPVYSPANTLESIIPNENVDGQLTPEIEAAILEFLKRILHLDSETVIHNWRNWGINSGGIYFIDSAFYGRFDDFALVDIDGDGIPEIILQFGIGWPEGNHPIVEIYRFIDGEFKRINDDAISIGRLFPGRTAAVLFRALPVFFIDNDGRIIVYLSVQPFLHGASEVDTGFYHMTIYENVINMEPLVTVVGTYDGNYIVNHLTGESVPFRSVSWWGFEGEANWPPFVHIEPFVFENRPPIYHLPFLDGINAQIELIYIPTMTHETLTRYNAFDDLENEIRQLLQGNLEYLN